MFTIINSTAMAMNFDKPVQIANFSFDNNRDTGFHFDKFFKVSGHKHYSKVRKAYTDGYGKGIAVVSHGGEKISIDFNILERGNCCRIGELNNYIEYDALHCKLYKIKTNEKNLFYVMFSIHSYEDFVIFGKDNNGRFVKYVDSHDIDKRYFGTELVRHEGIMIKDNMLVIGYNNLLKDRNEKGEFQFPWSDSAQWFGVEKVIY